MWDIELVLIARNINKLDKLITKIQAEFADFIISALLEIDTYQSILFSYYYNKDISKLDKIEQQTEEKGKYRIDEKDLKILELLSNDARLSTYEIAANTGISADTVGLRIKKLQSEDIIKKFTILPNLSKLGYVWYTFVIKMKSFDNVSEKNLKNS